LVHSITKPSIPLLDPRFCSWVAELAESYPKHHSSLLSSTEEEEERINVLRFGDWFTQQIETFNIESQEESGIARCGTKGRKVESYLFSSIYFFFNLPSFLLCSL
jgi:hypothetical protein